MIPGRGLDRVYPSLVAVYPVLLITSTNPGEFLGSELVAAAAVALAAGMAVHVLAARAMPRASPSAVALAAALANAWLFCATSAADRIGAVLPRVSLPVLLLVAIGVGAWALRSRGRAAAASRAAGVFTLALTAVAATLLVVGQARSARRFARSGAVRAIRASLPAPPTLSRRPDVYVVILDNLSNADVMRGVYGDRSTAFADSLRALHFEVPVTHSNYCNTVNSLAAFLNAQPLSELGQEFGPNAKDLRPLIWLSQDNAVSRWFRSAGYRVYSQPSVGFPGTVVNDDATGTFGAGGADRLRLIGASGALLSVVAHMSIPGRLVERARGGEWTRARARLIALRSLRAATTLPGPKLVIAHSLAAHPPYVYDSTCAVVAPPRTLDGQGAAYRAAVACTQRLVLDAVHAMLAASSGTPPIIVLQADHGTHSRWPPQHDSARFISAEQARECTGAFGAYFVPGGGLPDTVSTVNVMRYVLRSLGAPIQPVSDAAYYSTGEHPYGYVDVTPLISPRR